MNAYFPDSTIQASLLRPSGTVPEKEWVAGVHRLGGAVSYNHPFGASMKLSGRAGTDWDRSFLLGTGWKILRTNAYDADMIEIGYLTRVGDLPMHLGLWDYLLSHGKVIYGIGTSDAHGDAWSMSENPNQYQTWIWATDPSPESLIRGMKSGRMFFGDISRWDGEFDFHIGEHRCGDQVPLPGNDLELSFLLDPLPENGSVRLVQGLIEEGTHPITYLHNGTEIDPGRPIPVCLERPCFVCVEVYLRATGTEPEIPLLFLNPIVFQ